MIKLTKQRDDSLLLKPAFEGMDFPDYVGEKEFCVTNNHATKEAYVYIKKEDQNIFSLKEWIKNFASNLNFDYQIDLEAFASLFNKEQLLRLFVFGIYFAKAKLFQKHYEQEEKVEKNIVILDVDLDEKTFEIFNNFKIVAKAVSDVRNLQITPENFLNSEQLAAHIASDFSGIENLEVKILTKKEIQELNMGLILSVNQGSTHEPRVVIVKYLANPESREITSVVGKGITFDTGGVNTKGYHMNGMKYDMSGSVIVAYAVKALAQLKAKVNAYAVMCITDNRLDGDASLPENVYQSMAGKWVEVVDTDAEGRLVLADGIFYAAEKLNSTTIIDVATLTGTILTALSNVYTGIWSTCDKKWDVFSESAKKAQEKVWRMPFHKDFDTGNKGSKVADLANWSSKVRSDSNQAALFLKEFTKGVDFIHCDVAGTADKNGIPQGELVATLVEAILRLQK
ncbi:M17 family metallopeptidase [Mycoplasma sp. 394]